MADVHRTSYPLVGAPGEDVGAVRDAVAAFGRGATPDGGSGSYALGDGRGPVAGLRFGSVFTPDVHGYPPPP